MGQGMKFKIRQVSPEIFFMVLFVFFVVLHWAIVLVSGDLSKPTIWHIPLFLLHLPSAIGQPNTQLGILFFQYFDCFFWAFVISVTLKIRQTRDKST